MSDVLPYACSMGGPVLALPAEAAAEWKGLLDTGDEMPPVNDFIQTEYGGLARIEVGCSVGLLFDMEIHTQFLPEEHGGVFIRIGDPNLERAEAERLVSAVDASAWKPYPASVKLTGDRMFVFDPVFPAAQKLDAFESDACAIEAVLKPGTYAVSYAQDGGRDFVRLTRQSRAG